MADTAAHLVDRVLPRIPYRQFTLSFPKRVRFQLARDSALLNQVLRAYLQVLFSFQRRQAGQRTHGTCIPGAVTAVARAGGMANLNIHMHTIATDGVFAVHGDEWPPFFVAISPPTDEEVEALLLRIAKRTERFLARHQAREEVCDSEPDALVIAQSEAVMTPALPHPLRSDLTSRPKRRCAFIEGYSLHANVSVHENDRLGLERLCRYILRPPIATSRLSRTDDGRVRYRFRRPDAAGRTEIVLAPEDFLARLATLIPPPRHNAVRYHGCFAPRSKIRPAIVPRVPEDTRRRRLSPLGRGNDSNLPASSPAADNTEATQAADTKAAKSATEPSIDAQCEAVPESREAPATSLSRYLDWAALLERVFAADVTKCSHCGGQVRILAFLTHPDITTPILEHLGLPTQPPSIASARDPPQLDLVDALDT